MDGLCSLTDFDSLLLRTPSAFEIADANASVSNVSFPDEDLDVNEVGGQLSSDACYEMCKTGRNLLQEQ